MESKTADAAAMHDQDEVGMQTEEYEDAEVLSEDEDTSSTSSSERTKNGSGPIPSSFSSSSVKLSKNGSLDKPEGMATAVVPPAPEDLEKLATQAEEFKNKGNELYKSGNYREAIEYYTKAIDLCPKNAAYYGNRAAAYMMIKKFKDSISDAKKATSIDENFVKGYIREGKCQLALGDYSTALRCFQKVKEIEPKNDSIDVDIQNAKAVKQFREAADVAYQTGDYRKVVYLMDRALNHASDSQSLLTLKAECLALLGRYQEAQEIACDLINKDATNADAIYVRGLCLYYQDNVQKAFQLFQVVNQYSPDHVKAGPFYKKAKLSQAKKEQGNNAFKAGRYQEAYDLYTECLAVDPNNKAFNKVLYCNRATALSKMGKNDKAIDDCSKAIELDDGYIKAYLRRAQCYKDTEQFDQAVHDYEKVCKLDKTKENQHLLKDAKLELKKSKRKDYYKILGITRTSNEDEIKKAYRKSALLHHPDRFPNETEEVKKEEERKFKEVGEAYAVLSDSKKRARYDNGQDLDDINGSGGMGGDIDPNVLFQAFFGGGGGGGGSPFMFQTSSGRSSRGGGGGGGGFPSGFQFNFG